MSDYTSRHPIPISECSKLKLRMAKEVQHYVNYIGSDRVFQPKFIIKVFSKDIKRHLLNALNYAYLRGLLSITQRRGLITLIPKKNKP